MMPVIKDIYGMTIKHGDRLNAYCDDKVMPFVVIDEVTQTVTFTENDEIEGHQQHTVELTSDLVDGAKLSVSTHMMSAERRADYDEELTPEIISQKEEAAKLESIAFHSWRCL